TLTLIVDEETALDAALDDLDRATAALASAAGGDLFTAAAAEPARAPLRQMEMVEWIEHIRAIQRELTSGSFAKLVAAGRCDVAAPGLDATAIVARMARDFPECTAYLFRRGRRTFDGATPELLFRTRGRVLTSQALAGSLQAQGSGVDRTAVLAHSRKNL